MNNKTLILLGTILLAFIVIAAAPKMFKRDQAQSKELKNVSVDLGDYSRESTSKILIKQGETENTLSFSNGEWLINSEKANQTKIALLFSDLKEGKIQKLASKNEENQSKFQVNPENGITLILTQNGQDEEFYVGKIGPSYGTFYIRKKGIKNVYLVESGLRSKLSWDATEWKPEEENKSDNAEVFEEEAASPEQAQ